MTDTQKLLTRLYKAASDYFRMVETGVCDKDSDPDDIYSEFATALVETRILGNIDDKNVPEVVITGEVFIPNLFSSSSKMPSRL